MNDLDAPLRGEREAEATLVPPPPRKRAYGPISPPTDLSEFLRAGSVRSVADALRLSPGTVHRLRSSDYWPDDPRRIMRAWSDYKGRTGRIASSWFLRRVHPGGLVRHAARAWTGIGLERRVGELVAVARMPDGALLAQTLELPPQRLPLQAQP